MALRISPILERVDIGILIVHLLDLGGNDGPDEPNSKSTSQVRDGSKKITSSNVLADGFPLLLVLRILWEQNARKNLQIVVRFQLISRSRRAILITIDIKKKRPTMRRIICTYPSGELDLGEIPSHGLLDGLDIGIFLLGDLGAVLGFNVVGLLGDDRLTTTDDGGLFFFGHDRKRSAK